MNINENLILNTDSYKLTQYLQYPPNTTKVFSYIESRGGKYDATVFFGLQIFLKEYLSKPVTLQMIDEAEEFVNAHGYDGLFNREGWEYIVNELDGKIPLKIRAVPEGTVIPFKNALVTVENTDPKCFWLTSYMETAILRSIWYATTVATNSYTSKQIIMKALEETSDDPNTAILFAHHDFGSRGVSSFESAGIGGAAHLINFMGSDTITGVAYANKYYDAGMAGFSINASEHSTITSWGKENEVDAYRNMIQQFAQPGGLVACVSDSYDIYNAVENLWGGELRQEVIDSGAILVVRPDSGNPAEVVLKCAKLLDKQFGSTINDKGFKVLNHVKIIQGDGIDHSSIRGILMNLKFAGFSADIIAFGQGGQLLQAVDRDVNQFAMKCSAAVVDGEWRDVYKQPITDPGKNSKKGLLTLYRNKTTGEYITMAPGDDNDLLEDVMVTVFVDGNILREYSFDEVRTNSNK